MSQTAPGQDWHPNAVSYVPLVTLAAYQTLVNPGGMGQLLLHKPPRLQTRLKQKKSPAGFCRYVFPPGVHVATFFSRRRTLRTAAGLRQPLVLVVVACATASGPGGHNIISMAIRHCTCGRPWPLHDNLQSKCASSYLLKQLLLVGLLTRRPQSAG